MLERATTSLRLRALDARDRFGPRRDPLVPSRRLQSVGAGGFVRVGEEFLAHFTALAGLGASDRVLDVGCGIGRMARPLTRVLDPDRGGSYDGFDVNREAIEWCRPRYAEAHPHFRFQAADLYNRRYRPDGGQAAGEYRFPYDDAVFDLAIATSVFTHLLEAEADHYLAECARVLAPGGRLFATFFLLDEASRAGIAGGGSELAFLDPAAHVAVLREDVPEEAVAYDAGWVRERLAAHGLGPAALRPGTWSGRGDGLSFQDIVVARHA